MTTVFVGRAEALRREHYEPVYKERDRLHYKDGNGHLIYFHVERDDGDPMSWRVFRNRHDGEQLIDERLVRGNWEYEPSFQRYWLDAQVDDATLEEAIETAEEIDKAFAAYASAHNQQTAKV